LNKEGSPTWLRIQVRQCGSFHGRTVPAEIANLFLGATGGVCDDLEQKLISPAAWKRRGYIEGFTILQIRLRCRTTFLTSHQFLLANFQKYFGHIILLWVDPHSKGSEGTGDGEHIATNLPITACCLDFGKSTQHTLERCTASLKAFYHPFSHHVLPTTSRIPLPPLLSRNPLPALPPSHSTTTRKPRTNSRKKRSHQSLPETVGEKDIIAKLRRVYSDFE
jgi:hypothetical protein